jgi:hydroxypyruvate isomerase
MLKFSANLTLLFTDRPFLERFGAASAAGFKAVEFLFPLEWPVEALAERLDRYNLQVSLMNIAPGNWERGDRGLACIPDRVKEFRRGVEVTLEYARTLKCPRLHCVAGVVPRRPSMREVERCYIDNVLFAADLCAGAGVEVMIEPINGIDMPGYFLDSFDKAMSLMNIMAARGGVQPRLQFDVYHCGVIHGDIPLWLDRCADRIGYYQIGGLPDRHEPDIGLLPLDDIFARMRELDIDTWIGCEYHPRGDTFAGLKWLQRAGIERVVAAS